MQNATVNGVELEYEVVGTGEPVLLISPVVADGFLPLVSEPALADRYQLIRYHKRGWVGSTHTLPPVSVEDHAADAAALLEHLGVTCAHVAGHSSGAAVAAQLALDDPGRVATLTLLELSLLSVPAGGAFFEQVGPAFEAYGSGDHEAALDIFMSVVSGLDGPTYRAVLGQRVPGAIEQAVKDADTFFGVELPALTQWAFTTEHAAAIGHPVLSVRGTNTLPLWVEVADFLRTSMPRVEDCLIDGVGHLLHIERPEPVAQAIGEFLDRNPIAPSNTQSSAPTQAQRTPATQPGGTMPLIQVRVIRGVFDATEKEAIIEKLTDAMVSVEGEQMRPVTWVIIEEVNSGEWGIGGKALRTGDIAGMRSVAQ